MGKYSLELVEDFHSWDRFIDDSPQGTLFSYSSYLEASVAHWKAYWVRKGNQIIGGLCFVLDGCGKVLELDDLVIHNGLFFIADGERKRTKARFSRFEATEYVIEWLDKQYKTIELALSPQFEDMRPFLWHNYHSTIQKEKFELDLRYTSYVDISSLIDCEDETATRVFSSLETLRQRNIREARKADVATIEEGDGSLFCDYYAALMDVQEEKQDVDKLLRMKRLIDNLIATGRGVMLLTRNSQKKPVYATVFAWDTKRAYYLFGAPALGAKERYMGTIAFWDAFRWLAMRNIHTVDMEGVNSPQRGWFKMSFGGALLPYYQVYKYA